MDADLAIYREYRELAKSSLLRAGLWYKKKNTRRFQNFIALISFCLITGMGIKIVILAMRNMDSMSRFLEPMRLTLGFCALSIRIGCFFVHRNEIIKLEEELGAKFDEELENEKSRAPLLKNVSPQYKLMYSYYISLFLVIHIVIVMPVYSIFKNNVYKLVFPGPYPFAVEPNTPIYWIVISIEMLTYWMIFNAAAGVDCLFGLHCFRMSGMLRLASVRIANLNPNDPNWKEQLKECVMINQLIDRSKLAFEKVFGIIILWVYCSTAVAICTASWQLYQARGKIPMLRLIMAIAYMMLQFVRSFIFSYAGASVTQESENYRNAVYLSAWPKAENVQLWKDLLFILTRRTVTIKACGFFAVTMEFFEKVCNTTVSYFLLLQSLEEKN